MCSRPAAADRRKRTKVALPEYFCWTRFGTEAAEPIDSILGRKERERVANRGIFVWGIGNAIGPSIRELLRREAQPEVLFSPIKSTLPQSGTLTVSQTTRCLRLEQ